MRIFILPLLFLLTTFYSGFVFAEESSVKSVEVRELKSSIQEKAQELQKINSEIQKTETDLNQTIIKGKGISRDISKLEANVRQLALKIKAGEITIDKLLLELQELNIGINEIKTAINAKKDGIAASLRLIQQKDAENLLMVLLKSGSLSDGVDEAQNIFDLNSGLAAEITDLALLQDDLSARAMITSEKKNGIELETQNVRHRQSLTEDQKKEQERLLKLTKAEQRAYEEQLTKLKEEQTALAEKIDKLEEELRKNFNLSLLPEKRPGVFLMPVRGIITQEYGKISNLYRGKLHNGLDIGAPLGTEIFAARDGRVVAVGNNNGLQYGKYVLIEHDNGLSTLYAHMSRQTAIQGKDVKRGEIIGYVGNTGYSFGNHLHLGVYYCGAAGWLNNVERSSTLCGFTQFPGAGSVPIGVTANPSDYL